MQSLGSVHAIFYLCKLANSKLESLHNHQDISEDQTRDAGRHAESRCDNKNADSKDEGVSNQVEPDREPTLI